MELTVEALLTEPGLGLEIVVAGQLQRTVGWVQASELVTAHPPFLRSGDVILNDERWMHDTVPEVFVRSLVAADAAALGCGLRAGVDHVDPPLIEACRAARLTLFTVPQATPFVAVIERFVELLKRESEAQLLETIDRSTRLVEALGTRRSNVATRVLAVLRGDLEADVWLADSSGRTLAAAGNTRSLAPDALTGWPQSDIPLAARELGLEAVPVGGTTARNWLLVSPCKPSDFDTVIPQTVPFLSSALARDLAGMEAERRFASELVELIFDEQERTATLRLQALGFDPRKPTLAFAIDAPSHEQVDRIWRASHRLGLHSVTAVQGDVVTTLAQTRDGRGAAQLARALYELLGGEWIVGAGHFATSIGGIRRSIVQAREAAALASVRPHGATWAAADSLNTHRVLLELKDPLVLETFADALIGPIVRQDRDRGSDLVHTLTTFLEENGHVKATAGKLHVHVNTLRQRLARCEELTGRRLSRMEDRVDLFLALRSMVSQSRRH